MNSWIMNNTWTVAIVHEECTVIMVQLSDQINVKLKPLEEYVQDESLLGPC